MNVSNPTANQIRVAINHELSERGGRAFKLEVDLDLPAKGITAVFGESGSGKTTILEMLVGFEATTSGVDAVDGSHPPASSCHRMAQRHR